MRLIKSLIIASVTYSSVLLLTSIYFLINIWSYTNSLDTKIFKVSFNSEDTSNTSEASENADDTNLNTEPDTTPETGTPTGNTDSSNGSNNDDTSTTNENNNQEEPQVETQTILCLGDSVTNGYPYTGTGYTYPVQLQSKLDSAYGIGKVEIINQGVNGYRADQVLANVSTWLSQNNPDIVILMVGGNDLNQGLTTESTPEEIFAVINQTANEVQQINSICKAYTNPDNSHPQVIVSAFIPNNYEGVWGSAAISLYNSVLSGKGLDGYFTSNWDSLYDESTLQAKTSLMYDTLHPNSSGYAIIANNWYQRVSPLINL